MTTSITDIARTLVAQLEAGASQQEIANKLAAYLVDERRHNDVRAIMREVEKHMLSEHGRLYVRATSAHPLNDAQIQHITQIFGTQEGVREVVVETDIDSSVVGGVRCETANSRLDLTVRRQLQNLKTFA